MNYYIYTHSTPLGDIFYVGKGSKHRAYSTSKRSPAWRQMIEEHGGLNIKIVAYFDDEQAAYKHEKELIESLRQRGMNLVNATDGGKGVLGYVQTPEARARRSELLRGYKHELITCPKCGFTGGITSTKRWHFDKCRGLKLYKARTTVNGKRVFLGNHATKMEAQAAVEAFWAVPAPSIV